MWIPIPSAVVPYILVLVGVVFVVGVLSDALTKRKPRHPESATPKQEPGTNNAPKFPYGIAPEESEQINAGSAQPPAKEQFTEEPASAGAKSQVYGSTMVARTTKTVTLSRSIRDWSYLAIFGLMVLICWDASSLLWGLIYIGTWIANFAVTRQSTRLEFGARRIVGMFTIFIASVTILKAFYDTILDNYHSSILDGNTFQTLRFTEILPITMIKSALLPKFEAPVVLVLAIVFLWVTIVRLRSDSARARQSR